MWASGRPHIVRARLMSFVTATLPSLIQDGDAAWAYVFHGRHAGSPSTMSKAAKSPHPVRKYVERVASKDIIEYPEWDLKKPLPKLPVPELRFTCEKYLQCVKPIVSAEEYERTEQIVAKFLEPGGQGDFLQKHLLDFAGTVDSWAYRYWLEDMYLKVRLPLPINSNVGMAFPRQEFHDQGEQLRFAARLVSGILDYKVIIDSRGLPTDRARHSEKGQPMCMEQYYRLFCTYRQPGVGRDSQVTTERQGGVMQEPEHIIVACKNQFFVLDVVVNGNRLSNDNIYSQLKKIVIMAEEGEQGAETMGILTGADRDHWARARERLREDPVNRESLHHIETCIFILCLDDAIPVSFNHQDSVMQTSLNRPDNNSIAMQMLHGLGTSVNSCNRWFDKTMQFVVGADGACGLNYEHSPSEGIAVVQLIEHLLKYMDEVRKRHLPRLLTIFEIPPPIQLKWRVTPEVQQNVLAAKAEMDKMLSVLDFHFLHFDHFGREFPKSQKTSPDAFIQLALQLTYYRVHGHLVSTYESASIRRFRLGRVDNIRACTLEALEFCKAMVGEVPSTDAQKNLLFRNAIKKQTDVLLQTILGYGIDNHLLGLRQTAEEMGLATPEIFQDFSYQKSNHFTLSTSQVPTTMETFMLYGPVVPDGYGVCYNPQKDQIIICVTSFTSCVETKSEYFTTNLEKSLLEMRDMLLACPPDLNNGTPAQTACENSTKSNFLSVSAAASS